MIVRVFAVLLACTTVAMAADEPRPIDAKASHARFAVQHVLIERVNGSVPIVSGSVGIASDGTTPSAVDAELDPANINTGDSDRDGDLTGADWFDTKRFPRWTFTSNHVETNADGTYSISGRLTIHGTPVPVTLATSLVRGAPHPAYHATAKVDRHAFGMTVTRTDPLIGNEIAIELDVQTK